MNEYVDLTSNASTAASSTTAAAMNTDAVNNAMLYGGLGGTEDSMLQALLSSLPEPPVTRPEAPRSIFTHLAGGQLPPPLSPPSSPKLHSSEFDYSILPEGPPTALAHNIEGIAESAADTSPHHCISGTLSRAVNPPSEESPGYRHQPQQRLPSAVELGTAVANIPAAALPLGYSESAMGCTPPHQPSDMTKSSSFAASRAYAWSFGYSDIGDNLATMRPPSVLFDKSLGDMSDLSQFTATLETPASSRRNTDEVSLSQEHREQLQRIPSLHAVESMANAMGTSAVAHAGDVSPQLSMLDAEMPPVSPFFSRISANEIVVARDTVQRARLTRRNTFGLYTTVEESQVQSRSKQRDTWCAPNRESVYALNGQTNSAAPTHISLLGPMDRWAALASNASPSLDEEGPEEWLGNQEPPISPHFTGSSSLARNQAIIKAPARPIQPARERTFKVDVFSPFSSPLNSKVLPRVTISELVRGEFGHTLVEVEDFGSDSDVRRALRGYPWVLSLCSRQRQRRQQHNEQTLSASRLRLPSRRQHSPAFGGFGLTRPTMSFMVSKASTFKSVSDSNVRAIDIEAMVEAYLPSIHALLQPTEIIDEGLESDSNHECTPSESSSFTMTGKSAYAESYQSASSDDTLRRSAPTAAPTVSATPSIRLKPSSLRKPSRRSDLGLGAKPEPSAALRQLRAPSSVMNLRGAFVDLDGQQAARLADRRSSNNSLSQLGSSRSLLPLPSCRRRSEVESLITQANAVLNSGMRRSSTYHPPVSTPARHTLPPRASFPVSFGSSKEARALRSSIASPRSMAMGLNGSRYSLASEPGYDPSLISRIPSPVSGLRAPVSLAATLSRHQQHRLDAARNDVGATGFNDEFSQPSRSLNAEVYAAHRSSTGNGGGGGAQISSQACGTRASNASIGALGSTNVSRLSSSNGGSLPLTYRRTSQDHPAASTPAARTANTTSVGANGQGVRRLPSASQLRLAGSTSTRRINLNSSGYGSTSNGRVGPVNSSNANSERNSDEMKTRRSVTVGSTSASAPGLQRPSIQNLFKQDDEFLTLRPVHTPDIVPRTIDPRLVERAMTPMLKTNVGILHSSIADMLRTNASPHAKVNTITLAYTLSDDDDDEVEDFGEFCARNVPQSPDAAASALATVPEVSPNTEGALQSHLSPLNSPAGLPVVDFSESITPKASTSNTATRSSFSGRFGRPSFLSRNRTKSLAKPETTSSAVSGIPMPSFSSFMSPSSKPAPVKPAKAAPPVASVSPAVASSIPTLRKARSLWTLRSSIAK
ncbi:hypothetical protein LPJ66_003015 [Kickxella alabastrina]|uniref:Uncharacterized protein n=1 Tax=Kickxella alabastrina TaxID=61397 RepID=A0ACC1INP1_9FUNG|nr:hypothetical protein LPJ66_003015 [Kickxella alabastrina]